MRRDGGYDAYPLYFHLYLSHQLFRHWISLLLLKVVALIPELGEKVKPELSYLLSELRNRSISEVLELFP